MHSTVKMSKNAKFCLSLVKIEMLIEKSCEKNSSKKYFFRLIRPIFHVVSKKVIFTAVGIIYLSKNGFKVLSISTLHCSPPKLATFTTVQSGHSLATVHRSVSVNHASFETGKKTGRTRYQLLSQLK